MLHHRFLKNSGFQPGVLVLREVREMYLWVLLKIQIREQTLYLLFLRGTQNLLGAKKGWEPLFLS